MECLSDLSQGTDSYRRTAFGNYGDHSSGNFRVDHCPRGREREQPRSLWITRNPNPTILADDPDDSSTHSFTVFGCLIQSVSPTASKTHLTIPFTF